MPVDVLHERAAALDIGKRDLKACVRTPHPSRSNTRHSEARTFATTTNSLLRLRDRLLEQRVSIVVMEATGDYWRPPFYLLEDALNVILVNAAHAKNLPGRKSDVADAGWLAQLAECGLLRASFVPPESIRQLGDLTRYRSTLLAERSREVERLEKELEDAGIKLSSIATDILGVSGRLMLQALIDGERDPTALAELAKARIRRRIPDLTEALVGNFGEHHAFLCRLHRQRIDQITTSVTELSTRISEAMAPFREELKLLDGIPGIGPGVAETPFITAVWHVLSHTTDYHDLGGEHHIRRDPERAQRRAIRALNPIETAAQPKPLKSIFDGADVRSPIPRLPHVGLGRVERRVR